MITNQISSRRRGEHSTTCKCMNPFYSRPADFKPLPGELGHAQRNLVYKDKKTGEWIFRRRVSRSPFFVFLRPVVGRQRGFRPERRNLLDALFVLLVDTVDLATGIVTINLTKIAERLSPKNEDGTIDFEHEVTISRVSRLIDELIKFGVLAIPEDEARQYDVVNKLYFPKHVIITEQGWRLTGVNIDKLYAQQQERLAAEAQGVVKPGEVISLRAARRRWYENSRLATLKKRRSEAQKQKSIRRLSQLDIDDRKHDVAKRLMRSLPNEILFGMSDKEFDALVWRELYQLDLGLDFEPRPPDSQLN